MSANRLVFVVSMAVAAAGALAAEEGAEPPSPQGPGAVKFNAGYTMMIDESEIKPAKDCMAVSKLVAEDARDDKEGPIGKRRYEADAGLSGDSPIRITGDLVAWLQEGVQTIADRAGVKSAESAPVLVVRLKGLELNEETHDNSDWRANVTLDVELERASGESCWRSEYWAGGKNWGDPKNKVNYRETINRALDRALADLMKDKAFADALCERCK